MKLAWEFSEKFWEEFERDRMDMIKIYCINV